MNKADDISIRSVANITGGEKQYSVVDGRFMIFVVYHSIPLWFLMNNSCAILAPMSMELSHHEQLLDQIIVEPEVLKMQDELRLYNAAILEASEVTEKEVQQLVEDLNDKYMPMFKNGATISGYMEFPKPGSRNLETQTFETESRYYDEQEVEVYGFMVASEEVRVSEDAGLSRPVIALNIGRNAEPEECELEDDDVEMYMGMVRAERVDIVPFTMSPERARAWVEYYYPDALLELETRLLNAPHEGQALVNLAGFSVELHNDEHLARSRQAFTVYLNSMLRFDMKVPYMANMEGFVYVPDGNEHSRGFVSDGNYLTYFHEFFIVPDDLDESVVHIPMVELTVIKSDFDGIDQELLSHIETIKAATSIRQNYYGR